MKKDLQQLFDEFMYECEFVRKARPATLRGYQSTFILFRKIVPAASIQNLDTQLVVQFFKILQERKRIVGRGSIKTGVKKSTVATYWSKLNTFFSWLVMRECIEENPFTKMDYPTPSYEERKFLKREDVEKIITAIHNHHDDNILLLKRNLVLFYLFLFCGLRREEVMLMQVRDIDFGRKVVTVRGENSKSGMTRQVPLHSMTIMYLKDYLQERKKYTTPYLIVSRNRDDRLTNNGLMHLVERIRQASGVQFHPHQFRHTFAVNFLKSSNNIVKLKQLLGHKDIRMTLVYLRCLPVDEMREDIEHLNIDNFI